MKHSDKAGRTRDHGDLSSGLNAKSDNDPNRINSRRQLKFAAAVAGVFAMCTFWSSPVNAGDLEIGPWLGWAAGPNLGKSGPADVAFVNAGFDVTTPVWSFGGGYGGAFEFRFGPWIAFQSLLGVGSMGEGGLTLLFTQSNHAQWGTFGVRMGGGYGLDNQAHFVTTLWGGVRYVPVRAGEAPDGIANKATGIRIVATAHHQVDPENISALVFGVEFEPEYLLPPYSLFKWGGKH